MVIYHAAITAASDALEQRTSLWHAHLERLVGLGARGLVIGGGPSPDGKTFDVFYRLPQPSEVKQLIEEDPYYQSKVWVGYTLRNFSQFVEPWELPPLVIDGSRVATVIEGEVEDRDMATFSLIELRGAGRLAFGGFFQDGTTLALMKTGDSTHAIGWLADTGFWRAGSLSARALLWVL